MQGRSAAELFDQALKTARPVDLGAVVGNRKIVLLRHLGAWAGRQTFEGEVVTPALIAEKAARYWLGLPDRETFTRARVVRILAYVLAKRERWGIDRAHTPEFLARQGARGARGGVASGEARRERAADRDERIRADKASGLSLRAIGRRHGLSHVAIAKIVTRDRETS